MDKQNVILLVDDEESILRTLKRSLRTENYKTLTALSGKEGLEILSNEHVDLVISDQRMPEMIGSDFLRIVKDKYPTTIRMMLSGYSDFNNLVSAINDGEIFRFISKPWDNDELKEIIRFAIMQKRAISIIESIMQNVCEMINIVDNVSIDTSDDQKCIVLEIESDDNLFSNNKIFEFIQCLFNSLEQKTGKTYKQSAGVINKKEGAIMITFDIGEGLLLKIKTKYLEKSEEGI